jgi:hypothetical protein
MINRLFLRGMNMSAQLTALPHSYKSSRNVLMPPGNPSNAIT